mmetsp:Transcript_14872/g.42549  ORF Transcript_14872/g.42549 Transcript_14872/m.42549 type:complete len:205 (-) Transcript_14872:1022-1636(-)
MVIAESAPSPREVSPSTISNGLGKNSASFSGMDRYQWHSPQSTSGVDDLITCDLPAARTKLNARASMAPSSASVGRAGPLCQPRSRSMFACALREYASMYTSACGLPKCISSYGMPSLLSSSKVAWPVLAMAESTPEPCFMPRRVVMMIVWPARCSWCTSAIASGTGSHVDRSSCERGSVTSVPSKSKQNRIFRDISTSPDETR